VQVPVDNKIVKWLVLLNELLRYIYNKRRNMLTEWLTNCLYILVAYMRGSVTDLCSVCYTTVHYWFTVYIMVCLLSPRKMELDMRGQSCHEET
jgi:hypothetical protein